jgi:hypothetical protein
MYLRKLQLKRLNGDYYATVALPKMILEAWIADEITHVGFDYAEDDGCLRICPMKLKERGG